jgi:hypothetical protein
MATPVSQASEFIKIIPVNQPTGGLIPVQFFTFPLCYFQNFIILVITFLFVISPWFFLI